MSESISSTPDIHNNTSKVVTGIVSFGWVAVDLQLLVFFIPVSVLPTDSYSG